MKVKIDNYAVPEASCPVCQYVVDHASAIAYGSGKARKPKADDITICINCGAVLLFTHDAALRTPTPEETETIHQLGVWPAVEKVIEIIHEKKHESAKRP